MKKKFILILFLIQSALYYANDINATATPTITRLGEPITLTINGPNVNQLQLPNLAPFEITSDSKESTRRVLTIRSYQLGEQLIPTLNIYNTTVPSIPISVVRHSSSNEISPILNEIKLPKPWLQWTLMTLVIISSLGLIYYLLLKRKKKKVIYTNQYQKQVINPSELAIKRLKQLRFSEENSDDYFVGISKILKDYLTVTLETNTAELTSTELLNILMKSSYNKEELKRFRSIFNYCDTIKFYTLNEINHEYANDTVIPFINQLNSEENRRRTTT